jgi:hypothetical protein
MITATDALQLQKQGIPKEEHFRKALDRTEAAIIDCSRRGKGEVDCVVWNLDDEMFMDLVKSLKDRGFKCPREKRRVVNETTRALLIAWDK